MQAWLPAAAQLTQLVRCSSDISGALLRWEGELPANLLTAVSPEAFRQAVATHRLVVADFWVPWCNGCRRLYPKLKQIAANNPEVTFLSVRFRRRALQPSRRACGVPRRARLQRLQRGVGSAGCALGRDRPALLGGLF